MTRRTLLDLSLLRLDELCRGYVLPWPLEAQTFARPPAAGYTKNRMPRARLQSPDPVPQTEAE